jgi:hypothetical protein
MIPPSICISSIPKASSLILGLKNPGAAEEAPVADPIGTS